MKVEFWESPERGAELLIASSEFIKAKKSAEEFQSLIHATEAFSAILGFNYCISESEFELVIQRLEKGGMVILSFTGEGSALLEFSGSDHHAERVTINGKPVAHINPAAMEKIKAKYEKEAKRK